MNDPHITKPMSNYKVLVLGDDDRMVLPIVRSLGQRGLAVHLGWCPASSPAAASRYAQVIHDLPWYTAGDDRWICAVNELIEEHQFDLVIPATEHAVFALQNARQKLNRGSRIYLLDDDVFRIVNDKQATYQLCAQLRIPFPKTLAITDLDQFSERADDLGLPLIVKPGCSVSAEAEFNKNYVRVCHTRDEALKYIRYLQGRRSDIMLQRYHRGTGVGVELLARRGKILVALQHQRLHETIGHGSTYRETTSLDPRLLDACTRLVRRLQYTGVAMVEFRVDPHTGQWVLLEVNGRFWGSLPLADAAGVDFPRHLFEMLVLGRGRFSQNYRVGIRSRALSNDIRWCWRMLTGRGKSLDVTRPRNLGWVSSEIPLATLIVDIWRGITLQDHIDVFARADLFPAVREMTCLLQDAIKGLWTHGIKPKRFRRFSRRWLSATPRRLHSTG